jgi:hypothetical protein
MSPVRVAIQVLAFVAAFSSYAATNDVEQAIFAFPKISVWDFRSDQAVRSVNVLVGVGRERACAALEAIAKTNRGPLQDHDVNEKVCHLCRLLFLPGDAAKPLRPPGLGGPELLPLQSMKPSDWPYLPFAIVNDVPLSLTVGYKGEGRAERAEDYLAYCQSNGVFRVSAFPIPTPVTANKALNALFVSARWRALKWKDAGENWSYDMSEEAAKGDLLQQVKNMANPQGGANVRQPSGSETNRAPAAAASRRSP